MTKSICFRSTLAAAMLFALSSSGCLDRRAEDGEAWGGATVRVYSTLPQDSVYSVTVTITAPDIVTPVVVPLSKVGDQWVVNISEIPAGTDRTFTLSARDASGTEIYRGVATGITIAEGETASVSISGQETDPPPPIGNSSPVIDALVASAIAVAPGATVSLAVTAHDPDTDDTLTYLWSAPGGTFDQASASSTNWTAPETEGTYQIALQVQDSQQAQTTMSVAIAVRPETDAGSTATISVTLNNWPVVTGVTSTQGRIDVNESTTLDVVATDADSDTLTYAWTADGGCAGTFDAANVKSPTFTLGATLPTNGTCAFTVTVDDGHGGTNTGTLTIAAAPAPLVNLAPRITLAAQSVETNVAAGQIVNLAVQAEDPEASALTFAWTTTEGTLGTPTTTSGSSQVVWTAPNPFSAEAFVSCTVADAAGLTTVKVFTIAPIDTSAPTLTAFSFTPTSVDVTTGAASVTVTATISDDLSGFANAGFMFADPSALQWVTCWMHKPADSSGYRVFSSTCTVEMPQYSPPGAWKVIQVYLSDEASNVIRLTTANVAALSFPVDLTVTSGVVDVTGPAVTAFSLTPTTLDTSAGSVTVTASFTITDDMSGIWDAGVKLTSPSGNQSQICRIYPPDDESPLSFTDSCTVIIPQYSETGTWTVEWVYASDYVDNLTLLGAADLAAAGRSSFIAVTSSP